MLNIYYIHIVFLLNSDIIINSINYKVNQGVFVMNKTNSVNTTENESSNNLNKIPSAVFTPFKTSKNLCVFFIGVSFILSIGLLLSAIFGKTSFTQTQLKEIAEFTLNLVFVIAAIGLTIFTLPIKSQHPEKDTIILTYIGTSLFIATSSIFSYILSYCTFFNIIVFKNLDVFSLYFCAMLFMISMCILIFISTIIAYFNIRD